MTATLTAIMDALATQIDSELSSSIEDLQVHGRLVLSPTPPAIDIYPSDPFQEAIGFGAGNYEVYFNVRARVSTAENEGGQEMLLSMMDPQSDTSVTQAILSDRTLSGTATIGSVEPPSAFGVFPDPGPTSGSLLGCTWRVRIIP